MTASATVAENRAAEATASATASAGAPRLRVAMAHPLTDPAVPPIRLAPPADDPPDREGADAGSYATLADHPASDETMATPAEPPRAGR